MPQLMFPPPASMKNHPSIANLSPPSIASKEQVAFFTATLIATGNPALAAEIGFGAGSLKNTKVNWGQQTKHFPGHNNYTPGRSTITSDPKKLLRKAGTGQPVGEKMVGSPGSQERVNFGKNIGSYTSQAGESSPTSMGIIHYGEKGAHIVPARPKKVKK